MTVANVMQALEALNNLNRHFENCLWSKHAGRSERFTHVGVKTLVPLKTPFERDKLWQIYFGINVCVFFVSFIKFGQNLAISLELLPSLTAKIFENACFPPTVINLHQICRLVTVMKFPDRA